MTVISLRDVAKSFGAVQALREATLDIAPGECIGLVGHNGAGKSTLINVLTGAVAPSAGQVVAEGAVQDYSASAARRLGIRCVSQELSLCPNLTVAENTRLIHPRLRGFGWRRRAGALIEAALDEIFPGHGIAPGTPVADLTLTRRQMVENARAFTATDAAPKLVILDEPTSSLDAATAAQLLAHVRACVGAGLAVLFVSHMLDEVLHTCDRVLVMSEGRIVARRPAEGLTRDDLVSDMGAGIHIERAPVAASAARRSGEPLLHARPRMKAAAERRDGVFPLWSVGENIAIGSLAANRRAGLLDRARLAALARDWRARMEIRVPDIDASILSLSGGNQQKALFARALASHARIILMDDPMRGVDVATKQDVYAMIRAEAEGGRTFLWYTTEMDELYECDRVNVFREGVITASLERSEVTEQRVLQASF